MDTALLERLLREEESATLDFKMEQYPFAKASEEEKAELLKDILGFANAWRRADAYILIGIKEVRGRRSEVIGIPEEKQLHDHSLQQFVNNLTNQPVRFHYEALGFEGKQVGIIKIDQQTRPLYLKRDYGKLLKDSVYVRRGSSTDPRKPATLEEIASMRIEAARAAELAVAFAHLDRDDVIGTTASWDAEFCEMPENIPEFGVERKRTAPFGIDLSAITYDSLNPPNREYLRELSTFEFARRLFKPVRLLVKNTGQVAAHNVRVEIAVPSDIGVVVMDGAEMPDQPTQRSDFLHGRGLNALPRLSDRPTGDVEIDSNDDRFRIVIDGGGLQPRRRVWSDVFFIGKGETGDLTLSGLIYADNLPEPKEFSLTASVTVTKTSMSLDDLYALAESEAEAE